MRLSESLARTCLAVAIALGCSGIDAVARAQSACSTANRARAVRLAKQANARMARQEYASALEDLRAAYALCPEARLRHAMGCVAEASGAAADALDSFRACAIEAADEELRAECRSRAGSLEDRLAPPAVVVRPAVPDPAPPPAPIPPRPLPMPDAHAGETPAKARPSAVWNWVGVGVSVALIGTGAGFLGRYGWDRANARGATYYPDGSIQRDADSVSPTNAIVGGVCAGVGVATLITSLVLWPDAPAAAAVGPVRGGGIVTFAAAW